PASPRDLRSFPTRRSSDLRLRCGARVDAGGAEEEQLRDAGAARRLDDVRLDRQIVVDELGGPRVVGEDAADPRRREEDDFRPVRSEEHTSELQSPYDLVCR